MTTVREHERRLKTKRTPPKGREHEDKDELNQPTLLLLPHCVLAGMAVQGVYVCYMAEESQTETSVGNGTGRDLKGPAKRPRGEFESLVGPPPFGM